MCSLRFRAPLRTAENREAGIGSLLTRPSGWTSPVLADPVLGLQARPQKHFPIFTHSRGRPRCRSSVNSSAESRSPLRGVDHQRAEPAPAGVQANIARLFSWTGPSALAAPAFAPHRTPHHYDRTRSTPPTNVIRPFPAILIVVWVMHHNGAVHSGPSSGSMVGRGTHWYAQAAMTLTVLAGSSPPRRAWGWR